MGDFGFFVKKLITFFVEPLGLTMSLLIIGIVLVFLNKTKLSKVFLSLSFSILFLFSYPPFSNFLVQNLENKYQKYDYKISVKYIHVLGGGHNTDISQPISSHLSDASTKRVLEGIILYKKMQNAKIIFTGYAGKTNTPTAIMNAKLAIELGVNEDDLIINGLPKDTKEEAEFTKTIVGDEPFVLVTSASHMPRSMMLFESLGMHPIAAPTYFKKKDIYSYLPSARALDKSRMAMHEYIGILWAKLKS